MKIKKPSRKETEIQSSIMELLTLYRIKRWRQKNEGTWDAKKGIRHKGTVTPGISDIGGCLPDGRCLQIEVKRPENKKRPPAQIAHINEVNELGGLAFFATSVNDVIKVLKKEGYIK